MHYWVAEKSDGVRSILFVCSPKQNPNDLPGTTLAAEPGVYWCDRKFAMHKATGDAGRVLMDALGSRGDTLLDGELVRNLIPAAEAGGVPVPAAGAAFTYLMYDAVIINGKWLTLTPPAFHSFR